MAAGTACSVVIRFATRAGIDMCGGTGRPNNIILTKRSHLDLDWGKIEGGKVKSGEKIRFPYS